MNDYEHLGHGVYHLDSHYIRPGVASLYCIVQNSEIAFIDTGVANSLPYIQQFLDDLGLSAEQVKYVIPTHVHLDHAGGAGVMMQAFPNAQLVIHPRGARHMIDPAKLVAASIAVYGEQTFHQLYGEIPAIEASPVRLREIRFDASKAAEVAQPQILIDDLTLTAQGTQGTQAAPLFIDFKRLRVNTELSAGDSFVTRLRLQNLLPERLRVQRRRRRHVRQQSQRHDLLRAPGLLGGR